MSSSQSAEALTEMAIAKAKVPTVDELLDDSAFYSDPENYPYPLTAEKEHWLAQAKARTAEVRGDVIAAIGNETEISPLVRQYLEEHPNHLLPKGGYTHPSVLVFSDKVHQWMVEKMGGIYPFNEALLRSATIWFADGKLERERRVFDNLFGSGLLVSTAEGDPRYDRLCELYNQWRRGYQWKRASPEV